MSETTNIIKNFGRIKNMYNNVLTESIMSKNNDKKLLFKKYLKTIKENELLKLQFMVFTNIENKVEPDKIKAMQFVDENISLFSTIDKKDLIKKNGLLIKEIGLENDYKSNLDSLYENISELIFLEKTPNNIDRVIENKNKIVEYISNNKIRDKVDVVDLPNSMLSGIMVEKYNTKYSELNEGERNLLKTLIESGDDEKKELLKKLVRECIDAIDKKLDTNDLEVKDKLLKVKDKLLSNTNEINEDFVKSIIKLDNLKNNLI